MTKISESGTRTAANISDNDDEIYISVFLHFHFASFDLL